MQSIDGYVSRASAAGLTLRERLDDIRALCDLSSEARARMLELHGDDDHAPKLHPIAAPARSWLRWRSGGRS